MLRGFFRIFLIFLILLFISGYCLTAARAYEPEGQVIDSFLRYVPEQEVEAQPGEITIIEADSEYSNEFMAFDKLPLKFSLGHGFIGIENSTAVGLPSHLVSLRTGIEATLTFFGINDTYIRFGLSPSLYGDDWDFSSSDFRLPVRSFLIYIPDEKWTFLAGIAVCPDFETPFYPILGLIYRPNDQLTFRLVPERPNISYKLDKKATLFVEGGSSFAEYEVKKDNSDSAILRYRELHLGTGVKYKINEFIQTSFTIGGIFNRYLKYRDSLGKVSIKDGYYTEFRLQIKI
ncbi:MAG: DUF6268 family outer membrane beta-barrel protein [Candidatus Firestonebacteria bacterium]